LFIFDSIEHYKPRLSGDVSTKVRKYLPVWERMFPLVRKAPDGSDNPYCIGLLCRKISQEFVCVCYYFAALLSSV